MIKHLSKTVITPSLINLLSLSVSAAAIAADAIKLVAMSPDSKKTLNSRIKSKVLDKDKKVIEGKDKSKTKDKRKGHNKKKA